MLYFFLDIQWIRIQPTFVSEWRWFDQDGWRKRSGRRREEKEEQEPSSPPQQLKKQKSSQRGGQKSESPKVRITKQEQQWGREIDEGKTSTCSESRRAGQARDCGAADHRGLDDEVDLGGECQHDLPGPDPGVAATRAGGNCHREPTEEVDFREYFREIFPLVLKMFETFVFLKRTWC